MKPRAAWMLAAALAAVALLLAACGKESGPLSNRKDAPTAAALAPWLQLWLPPDLSGYRSHAEAWQEWTVLATFELPERELETFLGKNQLEPAAGSPPSAPLQQAWFAPPPQARAYRRRPAQEGAPPRRFAVSAWIARAADRATVYLLATDS